MKQGLILLQAIPGLISSFFLVCSNLASYNNILLRRLAILASRNGAFKINRDRSASVKMAHIGTQRQCTEHEQVRLAYDRFIKSEAFTVFVKSL
jgi:hypothetical protein